MKSPIKSRGLIDIIIVNYNSTIALNSLLNSIDLYSTYKINHILIIDNHSSDIHALSSTKHRFPIKIIRNKSNKGFSFAVNQGLSISTSKYVALINPDCTINKSTFPTCLAILENNSDIGIIGGLIRHPNNTIQFSTNSKPTFTTALFEFTNFKRLFPNNPASQKFWNSNIYSSNVAIDVDALCGAFMIIRNKHPNTKIYFDSNYFLYLEDLDFCISHKNTNYRVVFNPHSSIHHMGGFSSKNKYNIVLRHWYHSRKRYFMKHLGIIRGSLLWIIFSLEEVILKLIHPFDKYA